MIKLRKNQIETLNRLRPSGSILRAGVGFGKTFTSLFWAKKHHPDKPIIVITTAKKRDSGDWQAEAELCEARLEAVFSWNALANSKIDGSLTGENTGKVYIFDEAKSCGHGKWAKQFVKIAKNNPWILLSATPGDRWIDYCNYFLAHGFYKNKTQFIRNHVEYDIHAPFPKIKGYRNEELLVKLRQAIEVIPADDKRQAVRRHYIIDCEYDIAKVKELKETWINPFESDFDKQHIMSISEYCMIERRIVNSHISRVKALQELMQYNHKMIVFYNYNYELEIIKRIAHANTRPFYQWNGHRHDTYTGDSWVFAVQYTAGQEAWNCVDTNVIVFYSLNYSYRVMEQCRGRIDRVNTPFRELKYYYLQALGSIDNAILHAIKNKGKFNEKGYGEKMKLCKKDTFSEN